MIHQSYRGRPHKTPPPAGDRQGTAQPAGRGDPAGRRAAPAKGTGRSELLRHFEGWQAGAVAIGIALIAAILATPRQVAPADVPVPSVNRLEQRRALAETERLADLAEAERLPYEVRAVGESVRMLGAAGQQARMDRLTDLVSELRGRVERARTQFGNEPLLRLRAAQTRLFLRAVAAWESTRQESAELRELGGNFADKARRAGWVAQPHRLVVTGADLLSLYRIRWTELVGLLEVPPFAPSRTDWRVYYRLALLHPDGDDALARGEAQLAAIDALARRDPDYPATFARGVVQYQLGRYAPAVDAFRQFLLENPSGRFRLRAQNHLAAALDRSPARASGAPAIAR